MSAPRSTGLPGVDAQHDFLRARRRATISKLIARLRGEPNDVGVVLPYEEVIDALGFVSEHRRGYTSCRSIRSSARSIEDATSIVSFAPPRPLSRTMGADRRRGVGAASRSRRSTWYGSATSTSSVTAITGCRSPRALGHTDVDAYVTEVVTESTPTTR